MTKLLAVALAATVLLPTAAHAGQSTKLGTSTAARRCHELRGDYVGQGCRWFETGRDVLKSKTVNAKGKAVYRFRVPARAKLTSTLIGWFEPSSFLSCYGERKKVERDGRRVTVTATSGRHAYVSMCGIDVVVVRWSLP